MTKERQFKVYLTDGDVVILVAGDGESAGYKLDDPKAHGFASFFVGSRTVLVPLDKILKIDMNI